jgi:hypothetical protein
MGWSVLLVDENGVEIDRVRSADDGALHAAQQSSGGFLRLCEIDPYGLTCLNRLQIAGIRDEWLRLMDEATNPDEEAWVREVGVLMEQAVERVHTYLRFIGD